MKLFDRMRLLSERRGKPESTMDTPVTGTIVSDTTVTDIVEIKEDLKILKQLLQKMNYIEIKMRNQQETLFVTHALSAATCTMSFIILVRVIF